MKMLGSGHVADDQQASGAHAIHNGHRKIRCFNNNDNSWLFWAGCPYKLENKIRSVHVLRGFQPNTSNIDIASKDGLAG